MLNRINSQILVENKLPKQCKQQQSSSGAKPTQQNEIKPKKEVKNKVNGEKLKVNGTIHNR